MLRMRIHFMNTPLDLNRGVCQLFLIYESTTLLLLVATVCGLLL